MKRDNRFIDFADSDVTAHKRTLIDVTSRNNTLVDVTAHKTTHRYVTI